MSNAVATHKTPWNKGKLVGQKAPLRLKEIWAIRGRDHQIALRGRFHYGEMDSLPCAQVSKRDNDVVGFLSDLDHLTVGTVRRILLYRNVLVLVTGDPSLDGFLNDLTTISNGQGERNALPKKDRVIPGVSKFIARAEIVNELRDPGS